MKRVATTAEMRAAPSHLAARSWLHFHAHARLWGLVMWGRPDRDDAQQLVPSLRDELDDAIPPHRFLVDAAQLEGVDPDAFDLLSTHLQAVYGVAQHRYTAIALVVPPGVAGAAVTGFYGTLAVPCPFRAFTTRPEALAWLDEAPALDDMLSTAVTALRTTPPILDQLATHLRAHLADAEATTTARALSLSERTLQRRLTDAGTTFQKELMRLRIEAAKQRLADGDAALTNIALDLGFATLQHFSRSFHDATGTTPTDYRRQHRG